MRLSAHRVLLILLAAAVVVPATGGTMGQAPATHANDEYLWYEAENMRGISETSRHEPQLNPSYLEIPAAKAPGWSISGPGVSAEWAQGGERRWDSLAARADAQPDAIWQHV